MKRYVVVAIASFALGCIFKFAHNWSITRGNEKEVFRYIATVFVLVFIASLAGIALKLIFRNGIKKFNL